MSAMKAAIPAPAHVPSSLSSYGDERIPQIGYFVGKLSDVGGKLQDLDLNANEGQELREGFDDRLVASREVFCHQHRHVPGVGVAQALASPVVKRAKRVRGGC